jgi:predicted tellurium resistance membrane protein TerC
MEWILDPQMWIGLLTLTALEIVLGIDNIVFISIVAGRLPDKSQKKARLLGLALAMIMRVLLLLSLSWIMRLTEPLFTIGNFAASGRALILIAGGLFLLAKSTREIHHRIEGGNEDGTRAIRALFSAVLVQIVLPRCCFFARLGNNRRGDGRRDRSDDHSRDSCGRSNDDFCRANQPLH